MRSRSSWSGSTSMMPWSNKSTPSRRSKKSDNSAWLAPFRGSRILAAALFAFGAFIGFSCTFAFPGDSSRACETRPPGPLRGGKQCANTPLRRSFRKARRRLPIRVANAVLAGLLPALHKVLFLKAVLVCALCKHDHYKLCIAYARVDRTSQDWVGRADRGGAIVGMRSAEQTAGVVGALEFQLTPEEIAEIDSARQG